MKKIYLTVLFMLFITGCSLYNTPKKQAELFLSKYQTLDNKVLDNLDVTSFQELDLNLTQKDKYIEIMKKQYKDLVYEVKEEVVDGNKATVTVEIDVYDYSKGITTSYENHTTNNENIVVDGVINDSLFMDYLLDNIGKTKDRIKYTLNLTLTKTNGNWTVDSLTDEQIKKISGVYSN